MYTQHSETKLGKVVPMENGGTVKLLAQTQDHKAVFMDSDGEEFTVPASEFFQCFREATQSEAEAAFPSKAARATANGKN